MKHLIVLLILLYTPMFSQGWNSEVSTNLDTRTVLILD